jgi:hypothetical protein
VAVTPDHDQVGSGLVSHLHDFFTRAAGADHELPPHPCAAQKSEDLPPDLGLLVIQGFDQRRVGDAGSQGWKVPNVDDRNLGPDAGSQVGHSLEALSTGG